jgi:hypothetical protein
VSIAVKLPLVIIAHIASLSYICPVITGIVACLVYTVRSSFYNKAQPTMSKLIMVFSSSFLFSLLITLCGLPYEFIGHTIGLFSSIKIVVELSPEGHLNTTLAMEESNNAGSSSNNAGSSSNNDNSSGNNASSSSNNTSSDSSLVTLFGLNKSD